MGHKQPLWECGAGPGLELGSGSLWEEARI